jgi:hypothetical protein
MNGMGRLGPVLLAAVVAAGCVSISALTFVGSTSATKDEAYGCIHRYVTKAGYEIESADRAGGIIEVTRLAPDPAGQSAHGGAMYDFMSFTLVESKDSKKCSLQASVDGYVRTADGKKRPHEASSAARADAWAIINECQIQDVNGIHPFDYKKP